MNRETLVQLNALDQSARKQTKMHHLIIVDTETSHFVKKQYRRYKAMRIPIHDSQDMAQ